VVSAPAAKTLAETGPPAWAVEAFDRLHGSGSVCGRVVTTPGDAARLGDVRPVHQVLVREHGGVDGARTSRP
jgi:hypothetical protein